MNLAEQDLLVMAAQDGSTRALEALVRLHQRDLLRFAYGLAGDVELARDAVQEAWVRIASNIRRLDDPRAFRAWIYRQVRWRMLDLLRRARRNEFSSVAPAEPDDQGEQARENVRDLDLACAIRALAVGDREALELFYRQGLSIDEIAVVLTIPSGTVKSRLHRARHQLKCFMEGETDES